MPTAVERCAGEIATIKIDRRSIPQAKLDLTTRTRTSFFPWRGQFSPGLVEVLLGDRAKQGQTLLDPFAGSGTSLLEGARLGLHSVGAEVNPAAWALANFARLATLDRAARRRLTANCLELVEPYTAVETDLLRREGDSRDAEGIFSALAGLPHKERSVLTVMVLMAMGNGAILTPRALGEAASRVTQTLLELPETRQEVEMLLCDARKLPLPPASVDTIITSPPYINVFNYHQNYRPAAERLGWRPLQAAPSEMGANRKHRTNRFLTVVQYAMDMLAALHEMRRILKADGAAVVVIGRESCVRGVSFENGRLLAMLAVGGAGFTLRRWQEQSFVSRFGGKIFEDILTLEPEKTGATALPDFGRAVGIHMLRAAGRPLDPAVCGDLDAAILGAAAVEPSPVLAARDGFAECDSKLSDSEPPRRRRVRAVSSAL